MGNSPNIHQTQLKKSTQIRSAEPRDQSGKRAETQFSKFWASGGGGLVAQCSEIGESAAATPRVARSVFARNFSCGTVTEGWQDRCDRVFFGGGTGGVARHPRDISNTAGICSIGRGRSGGQTAEGHPKASPRPRQPLLAVPALKELESACRVSIL